MKYLYLSLLACVAFAACVQTRTDDRPERAFTANGIPFTLRDVDSIYFVPADSLDWFKPYNSPDYGMVASYYRDTMGLDQFSPYIQAQYFTKRIKWCSTIDSLQDFMYQNFLAEGGQYLFKDEEITTLDGNTAYTMGIVTQQHKLTDSVDIAGKHMVWAYIDQGEQWLGFNMTVYEPADYPFFLRKFNDLVGTYSAKKPQ